MDLLEMQFQMGDRVRKKSGSEWQGKIVGWYSTSLTPEGYAVESESHAGSVQIYPAKALELVGQDLDKCPECGGEADNGHDRCHPPTAYLCSRCMES